MDNLPEDGIAPSAKPEESASESRVAPLNKFEADRRENKQRKKRAHRRKLRRSNTKG